MPRGVLLTISRTHAVTRRWPQGSRTSETQLRPIVSEMWATLGLHRARGRRVIASAEGRDVRIPVREKSSVPAPGARSGWRGLPDPPGDRPTAPDDRGLRGPAGRRGGGRERGDAEPGRGERPGWPLGTRAVVPPPSR